MVRAKGRKQEPASIRPAMVRRLSFGAVSWGVLLACMGGALANPADPTVRAGAVGFSKPDAKTLQVKQTTSKAVIDWRSFSIDKGETTRFVQPDGKSVTLNRVTGNQQSELMGNMAANGQVFLVNQNGVVIGRDARIDVGSLVVTTADIKNADFMDGKYTFDGKAAADATIVNKGTITVAERGLAALVAPSVRNEGVIQAKVGQVVMAGAQSFTLDPHGDGLFAFQLDKASPAKGEAGALVQNAGKIVAEGGNVLLTARAAEGVVDRLIENTGVIEARSATRKGGKIVLDGGDPAQTEPGSGNVAVAGTLDASGTTGGSVTMRGKAVSVAADARISADGLAGAGGDVRVTAREAASMAGRVSVTAKEAKGGSTVITAEKVTLTATARIDASGDRGGGKVLVGGNEKGQGPERNARSTRIEKGAAIKADARTAGDGGRVIVWSDAITAFGGDITARGGADGGNGGFTEVSGKEQLFFRGSVELTAPKGELGTLLLDPATIRIQAGGANDGELPDIGPGDGGAADYTISAGALVTALNGANVSLAATDTIWVDAAVDASANPLRGSLSLAVVGGSISISQPITLRGDFTATAGFISVDTVIRTQGSQLYDTPSLAVSQAGFFTGGGDFSVAGVMSLFSGDPIEVDTRGTGIDGAIQFDGNILSLRSNAALIFNAGSNTILTANIGQASTPIISLRATGAAVSVGDVFTEGSQLYDGALTIRGNTLRTTAGGDILVNGATTLASTGAVLIETVGDTSIPIPAGRIAFTRPIDGARDLTVQAEGNRVDIDGAVGAGVGLTSLTVGGSAVSSTGATTTGGQTYNGTVQVALGGDYAAGGTIDVNGPVLLTADTALRTTGGDVDLSSAVAGSGFSLALEAGTAGTAAIVGAVTDVHDLAMTGMIVRLAQAAITGNMSLTGTNAAPLVGIFLSGNVTTDGGDFTASGQTQVSGCVSIDTRGAGGDGAIRFRDAGTINSGYPGSGSLALYSGRNLIDVGGGVGETSVLGDLLAEGRAITMRGGVATSGNQTYRGLTTFGANDYRTFSGARITVDGDALLSGDGTTTTSFRASDGTILFTGAIDGASGLSLAASNGSITIDDPIGGTTAPASVTATSSRIVSNGARSVGGQRWDAGYITLAGDYAIEDTGTFVATGPVTLGGDTSVTTADGDVAFAGTITGTNDDFSVDAGTAQLAVGATPTGIADLFLRAASIPGLGDVETRGSQHYVVTTPAGAVLLDGDRTTNGGAFTADGPALLATNVVIDTRAAAGDGAILLAGDVRGAAGGLTLRAGDADAAVRGDVGTSAAGIGFFDVAADGIALDGSVYTLGAQTYAGNLAVSGSVYRVLDTGAITVTGRTTINGASSGFVSRGRDVTFAGPGTIDGPGGVALQALAGGSVRVGGLIGAAEAPEFLVASGTTIVTRGVTTSGGVQSYTGDWTGRGDYLTNGGLFSQSGGTMTLAGDLRIATAGGIVSFGALTGSGRDFTVDADTGRLFGGPITGVAALSLRAETIDGLGDVTTTGAQTYTIVGPSGALVLDGDRTTNGGAFTVNGRTALTADVAIDTRGSGGDGAVLFSGAIESGSTSALSIASGRAPTRLGGNVGEEAVPLGALSIAAPRIRLDGAVWTEGNQTYTGDLAVFGPTYTAVGTGNITVTGDTVLNGAAGSGNGFIARGGGVLLDGTVDGVGGLAAFGGNGGAVRITGPVGADDAPGFVVLSGSTVETNGVTTSGGTQAYSGVWLGRGDYVTNGGLFTQSGGATRLAGDVRIVTDGGIASFGTVIGGGNDFTVDAGRGRLFGGGAIGGVGELSLRAFTIDALGDVTTTGGQTYTATGANGVVVLDGDRITNGGAFRVNGRTALTADVVVETGGGAVAFNGAINPEGGPDAALVVRAGAGAAGIAGDVGSAADGIGSLSITAGTIRLDGNVTTAGDQRYAAVSAGFGGSAYRVLEAGGISVAGAAVLDGGGTMLFASRAGDVSFGGALDGAADLAVAASEGGAVAFLGAVGGTVPLASLSATGSTVQTSGLAIAGGDVLIAGDWTTAGRHTTDGGSFTVMGDTLLRADTSIDSRGTGVAGAILLGGGVEQASSAPASLTLNSGTAASRIQGDVGAEPGGIAALSITAREIRLDGVVNTAGDQAYRGTLSVFGSRYRVLDAGGITVTGPVTLGAPSSVQFASQDGDVRLAGTVDGTSGFVISASGGAAVMEGQVGGSVAPAFAVISGTTVRSTGITTAGGVIAISGAWEAEGTYLTNGGTFSHSGTTNLTGDLAIRTAGGPIGLGDALAGNGFDLTADADTGPLGIAGAISGIRDLYLRADRLRVTDTATTGSQTYIATGSDADDGVYFGSTFTFRGEFLASGNIFLADDVSIIGLAPAGAGPHTITLDGPVAIGSLFGPVVGSPSLEIAGVGYDVRLGGAVGTVAMPLGGLNVTGASVVLGGNVLTVADQSYAAVGGIDFEGDAYRVLGSGGITVDGAVTLAPAGNAVLFESRTGDLNFLSTIDGNRSLTLTALGGGSVYVSGEIGSLTPLLGLTASGATVQTGGLAVGGDVAIDGDWSASGTYLTNGGTFTVTGDTLLASDVVVDTRGAGVPAGAILLDGDVTERTSIAADLSLSSGAAQTRITGVVGPDLGGIGALTIAAGSIRLDGAVTTQRDQRYTGDLTVSGPSFNVLSSGDIRVIGDAVLTGSSTGFTASDGSVLFDGAIDGPGGLAAFGQNGGIVRITGAVGGSVAPAFAVISGRTIETHGVATSGGVQVYTGAWTGNGDYVTNGGLFSQDGGAMALAGNVRIATAGGIVDFGSVIGGGHDFTVDADTGRLFGGPIAGVGALSLRAFTIDGLGTVETDGAQTYTIVGASGVLVLDGDRTTNGGAFTVNGRTALTADARVDTRGSGGDGAVLFTGAIETGSAAGLTITSAAAATRLGGDVGEEAVPLGTLSIAAAQIRLDGRVWTEGGQTYTGDLAVFGPTLTALGTGDIAVIGDTTLNGAPGAGTGFIARDGNVLFGGAVDGTGGLAAFGQNGGSVRVTGAIGRNVAPAFVVFAASAIETHGATTSGGVQAYTGTWTASGTYLTNGGTFSNSGAANLASDLVIRTQGGAAGVGTVTGNGFDLTVDADTGPLGSGAIAGVRDLLLRADRLAVTDTATTGSQTYIATGTDADDGIYFGSTFRFRNTFLASGNVFLSDDVRLIGLAPTGVGPHTITLDGPVAIGALSGVVAGSPSLTIAGADYTVRLGGTVGTEAASLGALTVTGDAIRLDGAVWTLGDQAYTGTLSVFAPTLTAAGSGNITVTGDTVLHGSPGSGTGFIARGGGVLFDGTVDGPGGLAAFGQNGGTVRVAGAVGGTEAPEFVVLSGSAVETNGVTTSGGSQVYSGIWTGRGDYETNGGLFSQSGGAMRLAGDVRITTGGGVVGFGAVAGGGHDFAVDADTGRLSGGGAIGGIGELSLRAYTIDALGNVTTAGAQTYTVTGAGGVVVLDGDRTTNGGAFTVNGRTALTTDAVVSTSGGAIAFNGAINPNGGVDADLSLQAGTGTASIAGNVGSAVDGIGSLAIAAGTIRLGGDVTAERGHSYAADTVAFGGNAYRVLDAGGIAVSGDATLTGSGTTAFAGRGGDVSFAGTVDGAAGFVASASGGRVILDGQVGGTVAPAFALVSGTAVRSTGINTTGGTLSIVGAWDAAGSYLTNGGTFSHTGTTSLDSDVVVRTDGGSIGLGGTLSGNGFDLTVDAGAGSLGIGGPILGVHDLYLRADSIPHIGSTATSGSQTYIATGTDATDGIYLGSTYTFAGSFIATGHTFLADDVTVAHGPMPVLAPSGSVVAFDGAIDFGVSGSSPGAAPGPSAVSLTIRGGGNDVRFNGVVGSAGRLDGLTVSNARDVRNAGAPSNGQAMSFATATFRNVQRVTIDGLDVSEALVLENIGLPSRFGTYEQPSTLIGTLRRDAYRSPLITADASAYALVTVNGCGIGSDPICDVTFGAQRPPELVDVLPLPPKSIINRNPFVIAEPDGGCVVANARDCVLDPNALATAMFDLDQLDIDVERLRFLDSGNEERW